MTQNTGKTRLWTMRGTIVGASDIRDFVTKGGRRNQGAVLRIREDVNDAASHEMAVRVSGEMCNYAGCVGVRVIVDYVVRVFEYAKNGIRLLGNDVYAVRVKTQSDPKDIQGSDGSLGERWLTE